MLDYLQKFKNLPQDIKDKISSNETMAIIHKLEKKYHVELAKVIMRIMVKDLRLKDLKEYFVYEKNMDGKQSEALVHELEDQVFSLVANYLEYVSQGNKETPSSLTTKQFESGANFFFDPEDEEEARQHGYKIREMDRREEMAVRLDEQVEMILSEIIISFSSVDLTKRFKHILKTYLRGIRDRVETRETLSRDIDSGGLNIDEELVDRILRIADKIKKQEKNYEQTTSHRQHTPTNIGFTFNLPKEKTVDTGGNEIITEKSKQDDIKKQTYHRDVEYDFRQLLQKQEEQEKKTDPKIIKEKSEQKHISYEPKKISEKKEMVIDLSDKEDKQHKSEKDHEKADKVSDNKVLLSSFTRAQAKLRAGEDKIKIEDVKHVPKLMGPIDELKKMDLASFRRISDDPKQAALKIKEMISSMEDESFAKRLEAIKAWRQSPLNKLYLSIGEESIRDKKSIDEVFSGKDKNFLNKNEFDVIMDLNKDLRY